MSTTSHQHYDPGHLTNRFVQGIVYKKTIGHYLVHTGERVIQCALSNKLRKELIYPLAGEASVHQRVRDVRIQDNVDPIAVGDEVRIIDAQDGTGLIEEVLPRRNKLARRSAVPMPTAHPFEQVIVANVDQVVPVFSAANPVPKWNLLDRYLVSAEAAGLPALICITKLDLVQDDHGSYDDELQAALDEYRAVGYPVVLVSAQTGTGIEELKQTLREKTSVFLGKSGVGKTTLLNALQPGLGLRVNEVSQVTGKGKHTTTNLEMFPLEFGGTIVDTPGIREFGLWNVYEDDLALFFPEMHPLVGTCRFGLDCQHDEEPGCAIRKAVMAGKISPRRYQSFMKLKEELL